MRKEKKLWCLNDCTEEENERENGLFKGNAAKWTQHYRVLKKQMLPSHHLHVKDFPFMHFLKDI